MAVIISSVAKNTFVMAEITFEVIFNHFSSGQEHF